MAQRFHQRRGRGSQSTRRAGPGAAQGAGGASGGRAALIRAGRRSAQLDLGPPRPGDRQPRRGDDLKIAAVEDFAPKRGFRFRRPRHTLKGRQDKDAVDRIGLRLKLRKAQAEAGDIVLLFADESEALTHPYLARAWARRGADLRVPAPGQAKKVAMMGSLDYARRKLVVTTSRTKRSADLIAHLQLLDRLYGPKPGAPFKPVVLVLDNGPIYVSKATLAALAERARVAETAEGGTRRACGARGGAEALASRAAAAGGVERKGAGKTGRPLPARFLCFTPGQRPARQPARQPDAAAFDVLRPVEPFCVLGWSRRPLPCLRRPLHGGLWPKLASLRRQTGDAPQVQAILTNWVFSNPCNRGSLDFSTSHGVCRLTKTSLCQLLTIAMQICGGRVL